MKSHAGKIVSYLDMPLCQRRPHLAMGPSRRDVLALIATSSTFLVAVAQTVPAVEATDIVIFDGWVLSPADLAGPADP